jgi:hypothetical protein
MNFMRFCFSFSGVRVLLGLMLLFVVQTKAYGYPSFIGYGYTSCSVCHYNPLGNGPLTDYGRALSASLISARPFFVSRLTTDEDLAERSGFFAGVIEPPSWIRPSASYRGLYLNSNITKNSQSRYITMQLEGNLTFKFFDDRLIFVGTQGYVPPPSTYSPAQQADTPTLISREHYVGLRVFKELGVYAGMMDMAYGLRVPDHTAYSRSRTFLAQNDQVHGVMVHFAHKKADVAVQAVAGNLFQTANLRLKGVTTTGEVEVASNVRLGASGMMVSNSFRDRKLASLHVRAGAGEGASVMAELGVISDSPVAEASTLSQYGFLQTMTRLHRGIHLLFTNEYFATPMFGTSVRSFRVGPSIQYFPMQRVELRTDLQGTRSFGQSNVNSDSISIFSQVHLSL